MKSSNAMIQSVQSPLLLILLLSVSPQASASTDNERVALLRLSIEQLMQEEVTSVSKKPQKLSDAPAAVYIITQDDIRRSGATSIADALRLAPGLEVGRVNSSTWAVSSRGFNSVLAAKLLVLIDGRTVYSSLFSGVYWDVQDTFLDDIDRIEVIRGPGAALWGANAVNGVINIITKHAKDTLNGLINAGGGTEEKGFGGIRYGGRLGADAHFRTYAKYFAKDGLMDTSLVDRDWYVARSGFRIDREPAGRDSLTLQGDVYRGKSGSVNFLFDPSTFRLVPVDRSDIAGGNVMVTWNRVISDTSAMTAVAYYDRVDRRDALLDVTSHIYDANFQHKFALGGRQEIIWGLGYRLTQNRTETGNVFTLSFDPPDRTIRLFSGFVQDDVALREDQLHLIVGTKIEHNDFTAFEYQPDIRLLWTPDRHKTFWGAVSRAVHTPDSSAADLRLTTAVVPGAPPTVVSIRGNRDTKSEEVLAFELGSRMQPLERISLDVATFYNIYHDLITADAGAPFFEGSPPPAHIVVPLSVNNNMDGKTYGVEVATNWLVLDWWRLTPTYTFLIERLRSSNTVRDFVREEDNNPVNQASLRSSMDVPGNVELDFWLRYADSLPNLDVPGYVTVDARVGWRPIRDLELSVVGQNLPEKKHPEFTTPPTSPLHQRFAVERSVYGKATWQF